MVHVELFAKRQLKKVNPEDRRCKLCVKMLLEKKSEEKVRTREIVQTKIRQREERKSKKTFSNEKILDEVNEEDLNTCVQVLRFIAQDPKNRFVEKRMKALRKALVPIIDYQKKQMYKGMSEDEFEQVKFSKRARRIQHARDVAYVVFEYNSLQLTKKKNHIAYNI